VLLCAALAFVMLVGQARVAISDSGYAQPAGPWAQALAEGSLVPAPTIGMEGLEAHGGSPVASVAKDRAAQAAGLVNADADEAKRSATRFMRGAWRLLTALHRRALLFPFHSFW
jgi:hypothetical protein